MTDGNNSSQLRIANATSGGARKAAGAKKNLDQPCGALMSRFKECLIHQLLGLVQAAVTKHWL